MSLPPVNKTGSTSSTTGHMALAGTMAPQSGNEKDLSLEKKQELVKSYLINKDNNSLNNLSNKAANYCNSKNIASITKAHVVASIKFGGEYNISRNPVKDEIINHLYDFLSSREDFDALSEPAQPVFQNQPMPSEQFGNDYDDELKNDILIGSDDIPHETGQGDNDLQLQVKQPMRGFDMLEDDHLKMIAEFLPLDVAMEMGLLNKRLRNIANTTEDEKLKSYKKDMKEIGDKIKTLNTNISLAEKRKNIRFIADKAPKIFQKYNYISKLATRLYESRIEELKMIALNEPLFPKDIRRDAMTNFDETTPMAIRYSDDPTDIRHVAENYIEKYIQLRSDNSHALDMHVFSDGLDPYAGDRLLLSDIVCELAANPHTPDDILKSMYGISSEVDAALAENQNLDPNLIGKLANHKSRFVRQAVVNNPASTNKDKINALKVEDKSNLPWDLDWALADENLASDILDTMAEKKLTDSSAHALVKHKNVSKYALACIADQQMGYAADTVKRAKAKFSEMKETPQQPDNGIRGLDEGDNDTL